MTACAEHLTKQERATTAPSGRIAYSDPFVPCEWIAAHGLQPVRMTARVPQKNGPVAESGGTCSFLRNLINHVCETPDLDGLILTTACDQMRYGATVLQQSRDQNLFLMNVSTKFTLNLKNTK